MSEITLKEQIEYIKEFDNEFWGSSKVPKAILASLKELEQKQEKCRWKLLTKDIYGTEHKVMEILTDEAKEHYKYCGRCGKSIEWVEE